MAVAATLLLAAPAAAFAGFGAIAVNPHTETAGKSWGFATKRGAERAAFHTCFVTRGGGAGCRGIIWVRNGECGAVGENPARTVIYWAFARTEARAAAKVLAAHRERTSTSRPAGTTRRR